MLELTRNLPEIAPRCKVRAGIDDRKIRAAGIRHGLFQALADVDRAGDRARPGLALLEHLRESAHPCDTDRRVDGSALAAAAFEQGRGLRNAQAAGKETYLPAQGNFFFRKLLL